MLSCRTPAPWSNRFRRVRSLLLVAAMSSLGGCPPGLDWEGELQAVAGEGGVAVLLSEAAPAGAWLWRNDADGTVRVTPAEASLLIDPAGGVDACYELRLHGGAMAEACATVAAADHGSEPSPALALAGEAVVLSLGVQGISASLATEQGVWVLRRSRPATGEQGWLDPACLELATVGDDCWLDEAWALPRTALGDSAAPAMTLPPYQPEVEGVVVERVGLYLLLEDHRGGAVWAGGEIELVFDGRSVAWGDLHAHSNLSMDGCEDPDAGCANRGELAGEDFFENAVEIGLDFAAITDHAEYDLLRVEDAPLVDIWAETQALVQEAEQPGFVPLLGYEWTHRIKAGDVLNEGDDPEEFADGFVAGHRNVFFETSSACEAYRVASRSSDAYTKAGSDLEYTVGEDNIVADSLEGLYAQWEAAAQECGEQGIISLFHHPAYLTPNPVSWGLDDNLAWQDHEILVEVSSEHGSSECRDPSQEGCGFQVDPAGDTNAFVSWGSIQEALMLGYRLGFAGGTDGHDGRPGSLDDGPSHSSQTWGEGAHPMPFWGAVTGVWLDGELSRDGLWEAISDRSTLATTARVEAVSVVAVGAEGQVWLPGQALPASQLPLRLLVAVVPADVDTLELVELVEPGAGEVVASGTEPRLELLLEDPGTPAVYLRARLERGGEEQRLWVSPLYIERD